MEKFKIRTMLPDDLTDVLQITDQCGLSHWSHRDYLDEAGRSDSIMLCAECPAFEVAGFLVSRIVPSSNSESRFDAEIYNIGVRPELQKSGCGTLLIECFLEKCSMASVQNIWLDVRSSNENAIGFYKRFSFSEFSVRKDFYSNPPENGIIMRLSL